MNYSATRYVSTDPTSLSGPLIPKRRAPVCVDCGRALWKAIGSYAYAPTHNAKGERLGYVPLHRGETKADARCFNSKACAHAGHHATGEQPLLAMARTTTWRSD